MMDAPLPKLRNKPTEHAMWQRLRPLLNTQTSRAYRIEAIQTPGFPDIVMITSDLADALKGKPPRADSGNTVWLIELKAGPLHFRPQQVNFIREAYELGSPVYVIWQKRQREDMTVHLGMQLILNRNDPGKDLKEWLEEIR